MNLAADRCIVQEMAGPATSRNLRRRGPAPSRGLFMMRFKTLFGSCSPLRKRCHFPGDPTVREIPPVCREQRVGATEILFSLSVDRNALDPPVLTGPVRKSI